MKKLLALTLAVAMVLSMAAVSFASSDVRIPVWGSNPDAESKYEAREGKVAEGPFYWNQDEEYMEHGYTGDIDYGTTAYYALIGYEDGNKTLVYEQDAVKGLKIKSDFDLGKEYVEGVKLVKKKLDPEFGLKGARSYAYFIAIETEKVMTTKEKYISGKIELSKSGDRDWDRLDKLDRDDDFFYVDLTLNYEKDDNIYVVDKDAKTFEFEEDDELELTIIDSDIATYTVNTYGQGKLVLKADNKFLASVSAKYPEANMDFVTIDASAPFNKIGELRIYAEEGNYAYGLNDDGTLRELNAKYDESDEAFVIRTRTLGSFVVSDVKLDLAPEAEVKPAPDANKPFNPGTGAAC